MSDIKYKNKEIENFLESEYINIRESESRILEFLKNREKVVEKPDFNGNIIKKVQFVVLDPDDPERKERKLELSRKHVVKIYNELMKGYSVLEIFRTGQGKQTEYHVKHVR
jgi:hypothetical protein